MNDIDGTINPAAETSQAASGATAGSPAPQSQSEGVKPVSPPAAGDKKPGSLSEALAEVKLEEPAEEAAGQTEPQPGEAPTTEAEQGQEPKAEGQKDEQPKAEGADAKPDDVHSQLFNERPEWKALDTALGAETAKKVRPILRQVMEREMHAVNRVKQLQPKAEIADEFRGFAGDEQGFQTMRNIVRAYATDPASAVPILEQMLQDARGRAGFELCSADLKEQAAFIDKSVEDGLMDPEAGKKLRANLTETEKARAKARQSEQRLQQQQQQQQSQEAEGAVKQVMDTLNSWEANIRQRYPDFGNVTEESHPDHGKSVADQVFDALQLARMRGVASADGLLSVADKALKLAMSRVGAPAPRQQRVITSQGSSVTAKPRPRTMREAMDSVKLD